MGRKKGEGEYVLETEREVGVEEVLALAGVGECDSIKGDDGWGKLADIFKVESEWRSFVSIIC
jgi:hypothetical protein